MSKISLNNLTFKYENSNEEIFKNVSLTLDTDWKLCLIGRNGRGKTTLLKILNGDLSGSGIVDCDKQFSYFPFEVENDDFTTLEVIKNCIAPFKVWEDLMNEYMKDETKLNEYGEILEKYIENDGYIIEELIKKEINLIGMDTDKLNQKFGTLSGGEQTKMLLVSMFLRKNHFLLIDEPTNHLDIEGRKIVSDYLASKKGFILVSHDRNFVDKICDHILSINKANIDLQKGNYSSWQFNKDRQDNFELAQNEKLEKDIERLKTTAKEKARWSDRIEASKFGSKIPDRGFVGHKSAKMMKRAKNIENRQNKAIEEKSMLLKNLEKDEVLELKTLDTVKEKVVSVTNFSVFYEDKQIFEPISFDIKKGECVWLKGENGSGKSSIIKVLMDENISYTGNVLKTKSISYVSQKTDDLIGDLVEFIDKNNIDGVKLRSNLRKLGFEREQFDKKLESWSEGQKKKLLIAKSLTEVAELYIWDEPLNFIDIITRKQLEDLILKTQPTMLIVEHDATFLENIVTKIVDLKK